MSPKHWLALLSSVALVSGCGSREETTPVPVATKPAATFPGLITFKTRGTMPEGIEFDTKNQRFLVGSMTQGTVSVVAADGTLTPFVQDPELKATVGIEVDEQRNRLLVANTDGAVFEGKTPGFAKLGIYDLDSGKRIAMVDLSVLAPKAKSFFANDIAVGDDGSAYITDTNARVIFKVDPSNVASVFVPDIFPSTKNVNLNGIVFNPAGYLLVSEYELGELYKVPLADPTKLTTVQVSEPLKGGDGLITLPNGHLVLVRSDESHTALALTSIDEWATATVAAKATARGLITTAALVGEDVYAVHPQFDNDADPLIEKLILQ